MKNSTAFLLGCLTIIVTLVMMFLAFDHIDAEKLCLKLHSLEVCQHELNR